MSDPCTRVDRRVWLTRNLKTLSVVSLLQDTASEMLYPILPLFITGTLGAPVAVVGIIEGLADGVAALTKIVSGRLADRWRRRPLIGAGYGVAAAAKALIAVSTVWPLVLLARMLDRFGKGVRGVPRDALIADNVPREHLGRAFGFHRAMDSAGAVIGPLLGLGLFELFHRHYRPVFVIAVIPAVLSATAVVFVRESPTGASIRDPHATSPESQETTLLPKEFWGPFTILSVFALVNFSDALLIVRAKHLGLSVSAVIAAYALYNLTYTLVSYPAGVLADRLPKQAIIGAGFAIFGVSYLGLGFATNAAWVWPIFALYGVYTGLTDGVSKAWISATVGSGTRGRALGLQGGAAGIGSIIAGAWAGLAWNGSGRGPLIVAGSIALALAVVVGALTVRLPRHPGGGVDAVVIATKPDAAEATMRECAELGVTYVCMHRAFGEGSVCRDATVYGREHGITVIDGGCPLMFEPTADVAHTLMRFVLTRTGKVPKTG